MRVRPFLFGITLSFSCLIGGAGVAGAPVALTKLLQTLRDSVDAEQARRDVQTIWETDRWFTFPNSRRRPITSPP
jgi:hypothetical protein